MSKFVSFSMYYVDALCPNSKKSYAGDLTLHLTLLQQCLQKTNPLSFEIIINRNK